MSNDKFKEPLTSITQDSSDQTFHVKGDKSVLTDPGHSEALGLYDNNMKTSDISKESCSIEENKEQYEDCREPGAEKGAAESVSVIKTAESVTDRTTECVTDRKGEKHNVILGAPETTIVIENYSNRNDSDSKNFVPDFTLEGDKTAINEIVGDYDNNTLLSPNVVRKDKTQQSLDLYDSSRVENTDIGIVFINGVDINNDPSKNVENRQPGDVDYAESAKNRQTGEDFTDMDGILDKGEVKILDVGEDKSIKDKQTDEICTETDGILIDNGVENLDEQVNEEQRNTNNVQSNLALKMSGTGQPLANNQIYHLWWQ